MAARVSENHRNHGKKNLPRVRKTTLAEEDLEGIWLYIAADNIVAADALLDKLVAKSTLLASNPELGRAAPKSTKVYAALQWVTTSCSTGPSPEASNLHACYTGPVTSIPYFFSESLWKCHSENYLRLLTVTLGLS